ncbi:MAG: SRPBCC domain-containing protein [Gemmatimonas sp.]|nr:SRPBCC domain-containing protein [Gemmatimonas sp.]
MVVKLSLPPITKAVVYEHPPARVWRALTDPELLAGWLMRPVGFAPVVGTHFEFRADPAPGFDGIVRCEVVECAPPNAEGYATLAYHWQGGPMKRSTLVRWTLTPLDTARGAATRVDLSHSGFDGFDVLIARAVLGLGWRRLLVRQLRRALESLANHP